MSHVVRKPVFRVCDQLRRKLACSADETNYIESWNFGYGKYRNDPKFLDRYTSANSADPDQTAPLGSGSTLFAIPSAPFGLITLWQSHIVQVLEWLQQFFGVSEYIGNLSISIKYKYYTIQGVNNKDADQTAPHGWAGWYMPLLFACGISRFSHDMAHMVS